MYIHEIQHVIKSRYNGFSIPADVYKLTVINYIKGGDRVLDIGCGRSEFMIDAYTRAGEVIGLDPDASAIEANKVVNKKIIGTFDKLEFLEEESVDLAVSSWVMEHIDDPDCMFRHLVGVLKKGGHFISITPNKYSIVATISRLIPNIFHKKIVKILWGRDEQDTYPVYYKLNDDLTIRNYAEKYGFDVIDLRFLPDPSYYIFNLNLLDLVVNLHRKFIKKQHFENILFVLQKRE